MEYNRRFRIVCVLVGIFQFSRINGFEKPCDMSTETAQVVDRCPTDEDDYKEAASTKNCSSINNTCESFVYHCVVNGWGNATIEVCAPWLFIIGRVCGEYSYYFESIRSTTRSCDNFTMPCPYKYNSTEQYKVPGCYHIADKANTSAYILTTEMSQTTVYSKSTSASTETTSQTMPPIKNVPPKKNEGLSAGKITGILFAVLVVILICLLAVFFFYIRRKMKNEQKSCEQVITTLPFCCQCFYEASIVVKMQKFMDKRYRRVDASKSTTVVTPDATSSVPLISNNECDEQITEIEDECDVSVQRKIKQQNVCFPQNQPDALPSLTATTARQLESKSLHSSHECLTPPSTSLAQKFNSSTSSLDVTLQPDQLLEADSSVSSNTQDKPLNYPPGQQLHPSNSQTEQSSPSSSTPDSVSPDKHPNSPPSPATHRNSPATHRNSPSFSAFDQPKDTSSMALQSEPLDLSISSAEVQNSLSFYLDKASPSVDLSINATSACVPTNQSENSPLESPSCERNSSVPKHPEVNPVTLFPSTPVTSSPSNPGALSPSNPVTSYSSNPVTSSPLNPVTLSPSNPVTLSPSNPVTLSPTNPITSSPSNPVTSAPSSSAFHGSGDSETTQKKGVAVVQPKGPEESSELAPACQTQLQQENAKLIYLGKRISKTSKDTVNCKPSTLKEAKVTGFTDRMNEDTTEIEVENIDVNDTVNLITRETALARSGRINPTYYRDHSIEESAEDAFEDRLNKKFEKLEKTLICSMDKLTIRLNSAEEGLLKASEDLRRALEKIEEQDAIVLEREREIMQLSSTLDDRDRELERKDERIAELKTQIDKVKRERAAEQRRIRQLELEKEALKRERDKLKAEMEEQNNMKK